MRKESLKDVEANKLREIIIIQIQQKQGKSFD